MKTLSLKLQDDIFQEVETLLSNLKKNRNAYINEALRHYNQVQKRRLLAKQLEEECRLVAESDYEVLREMDMLEDAIIE